MFYVTNKDKIISVVIALSTVLVLFLLAATIKTEKLNTIETSVNNEKTLIVDLEENIMDNNVIQNKLNK